jgi:hypothetical protein
MSKILDLYLGGNEGAALSSYVGKLRQKKARAPRDPMAPKKKPGAPEKMLQVAVLADFKRHASCGRMEATVSTAQGTGATKEARMRYGQKMKAFGVWAGSPDLKVWLPNGRAVLIELKAPGGTLSDAQKTAHAELSAMGFPVYTCRSLEEVRHALGAHGVVYAGTLRAALPAEGLRR